MESKAIIGAVQGVTKKWTKQRKAEERQKSAEVNRRIRLTVSYRLTIKDVAYGCMEEAYLKASGGGRLPAHARQIMYQARPIIQGKTGQPLGDQYFCQTLLPDYIADYQPGWDVVFDDRGHFNEPHTETTIGLGTISVRNYLKDIAPPQFTEIGCRDFKLETNGPAQRFGAVLFVEKEGFMPLFNEVELAERYDIAIMSTKGVSNTAARRLVDELCGQQDIPLLVLHDFDKSGFTILGTLQRSTRRYSFKHHPKVIDLGLRLSDVQELGLEAENAFDRGSDWSKRQNLLLNGATEEEVAFLLFERVELNALASDVLVDWIEAKLDEHGIKKIVPDKEVLKDAHRRAVEQMYFQDHAEDLIKEAREDAAQVDPPADLEKQVRDVLSKNPAMPWDDAVVQIAEEEDD